MTNRSDDGFAIVAAVAAVAVFAAVALIMLSEVRNRTTALRAEMLHSRLAAAADAGFVRAVEGLTQFDPGLRWTLDGRPHRLDFDRLQLLVTLEDEQAKAPLGLLTEQQTRLMFAAAGVSGARLDRLTDEYLDWVDDDDDVRPHGAEREAYAAKGVEPRNGPPQTLDELMLLPDMDAAILARLRPIMTAYFGLSGSFAKAHAQSAAIAMMAAGEDAEPPADDDSASALEISSQQAAEERALAGRSVTVRVTASDGRGAALTRTTVITLTGRRQPGFYIRERR